MFVRSQSMLSASISHPKKSATRASSTKCRSVRPAPHPKSSTRLPSKLHPAGYAAGANSGLAHAFAGGAEHALLLNDDVLVEPGCADALAAAAGADTCTAPVIDAPGADAFGGGAIDWRRGFGVHREGALDYL